MVFILLASGSGMSTSSSFSIMATSPTMKIDFGESSSLITVFRLSVLTSLLYVVAKHWMTLASISAFAIMSLSIMLHKKC